MFCKYFLKLGSINQCQVRLKIYIDKDTYFNRFMLIEVQVNIMLDLKTSVVKINVQSNMFYLDQRGEKAGSPIGKALFNHSANVPDSFCWQYFAARQC